MKKSLIVIGILLIFGTATPTQEVHSSQGIQTIPDEAIRLRILANSDEEKDQHVKRLVRDEVNVYISELVKEIDNIEEARQTIAAKLPHLREIVQRTLGENGVSDSFTVDYQSNVTFPLKMYDNYVYPAGEYEAVLITIGAGKGANWWCVLFPPLCFLDFSNGTTIEDEASEDIASKGETEVAADEMQTNQVQNNKAETLVDEAKEVKSDTDETKQRDKKEIAVDNSDVEAPEMNVDEAEEEDVKITFFLFEWLGWS